MVVGGRELIDTLWNVNEIVAQYIQEAGRINRYIMECKSPAALAASMLLWN